MQVSILTERIAAAIRAGLSACRRDEPMPLADWADQNFMFSPEGSTSEGAWETIGFQRPIMNFISHPEIEQINIVKSSRVGYTQMIRAALAYFIAHKKRHNIVYVPNKSDADKFMKTHAEPMIRDVPAVRKLAPWFGKKHRDSTLSQKRFSHGKKLYILPGNVGPSFRDISTDNAFYDELSEFVNDVEGQGSPLHLGDKRFLLSPYGKSIRGSSVGVEPDEDGNGCQMTVASRQAVCYFRRWVPCPHCGQEQVMKWGGPDCAYGIKWRDDDPRTAFYLCEHCACEIEQKHARAMDEAGVLRCDKTGIYTTDGIEFFSKEGRPVAAPVSVSVHVWSIQNPIVAWSKAVTEWLKTKGDKGSLKAFVNTTLGETWVDDVGEKLESDTLYQRREHYPCEVPTTDAIITVAVDVQDDRFEIQWEAWIAGEENYKLSYQRLYGDLSRSEIWQTLHRTLQRKFTLAGGEIVEPRICLIDSGGHFTDEVYKFSKKYGVRKYVPIKGHNQTGKPIASWPRKRNDKGVYLTMIGTDTGKELMAGRLQILEPGEGYVHFPVNDEFDEDYFTHLTNERRIMKVVRGKRVWVWDDGGRRNEPWDLSNYNLAGIRVLQQHFGIRLPAKATGEQQEQPKLKPNPKPQAFSDGQDFVNTEGDWI